MKRDRRIELNLLSLLAFGVKSRWYSILKNGTIIDGRHHTISIEEVEATMTHIIEAKRKMQEDEDGSDKA